MMKTQKINMTIKFIVHTNKSNSHTYPQYINFYVNQVFL
ncbi:MAG: hypothetical protein ACJAX4_000282 [Clostridium sp.]|jgi:hypothetical protein